VQRGPVNLHISLSGSYRTIVYDCLACSFGWAILRCVGPPYGRAMLGAHPLEQHALSLVPPTAHLLTIRWRAASRNRSLLRRSHHVSYARRSLGNSDDR